MKRTALALVAAIATALTLAPASLANIWPTDGQNAYNQRFVRSGGPTGSRAQNGLVKVWERRTGGDVRGTPILAIGGVFAGSTDGTVYAYLQKTGQLYWAQYIGGPVYSSPLYVKHSETEHTIYAIASKLRDTRLVAMDAYTGTVKWSTRVDNQQDSVGYASPAYSAEKNLVYVATCPCKAEENNTVSNTRGTISAVDATSGALIWKHFTAGTTQGGVGISGTPLVADSIDRLYVATGHAYLSPSVNANSVVALDTATGNPLGQFQARSDDASRNDNVLDPLRKQGYVSPTIAAGEQLGIGSKDGNFYLFDPFSLALEAKTQVGAGNSHGGVIGGAAYDGARIYGSASTPSLFWALQRNTGALLWAFPSDDPTRYGPVSVSAGVVWNTNTLGFLEARSVGNGNLLNRYPLAAPSTGGVSVFGGYVYAAIGTSRNTGGGVAAFK